MRRFLLPIWLSATFAPKARIGSGWPTSPTYRPGKASCTSPSSLDAWSRRVVGWAFALHLRAELVVEALEMAIRQRQPWAVVHHSDHGTG